MAQPAIDTVASIRASGRTGAPCTVSGPYRSDRNARIVLFVSAGTKFPPDSDGKTATWTLVGEDTDITPIENL